MDESDVHLLPPLRAMWIPLGKQVCIHTSGNNKKKAIFGEIDVLNGKWFYQVFERKKLLNFVTFYYVLKILILQEPFLLLLTMIRPMFPRVQQNGLKSIKEPTYYFCQSIVLN